MNVKDQILYNAEKYDLPANKALDEMAQQHIDNEVVDLIKNGKYKEAAQRYIDNHGTAKLAQKASATTTKLKRGDFAKNLAAGQGKVSGVSKDGWTAFENAYSELMGTSGQEKRGYKKTKGTVEKSTGEVKTTGQTRQKGLVKLENKLRTVAQGFQNELESTDDPEKKEEIQAHIDALETLGNALQYTKKGEATLPPRTEEELKKLRDKYKKIGLQIKKAAKKEPEDETDEYDEKVAADAIARLQRKLAGVKDLSDVNDLIADFRERKEMLSSARTAIPHKIKESMNLRGFILAESYGYEGVHFWENYIMSDLLRAFNEDVNFFGKKEAFDIYVNVFGESTAPVFEYMVNHEDELNEAAKIKGQFLFETVGYDNLHRYLTEAIPASAGFGGAGRALRVSNAAAQTAKGGALASGLSKIGGFLSGLWGKIKNFGKPIVDKLGSLVSGGVGWAKKIAQQGMNWLYTNPVAKVAVPAIALAGTIGGGVALINKLRKRAGKDKLSKEEEQKFKELAQENKDKLKRYGAKVAA